MRLGVALALALAPLPNPWLDLALLSCGIGLAVLTVLGDRSWTVAGVLFTVGVYAVPPSAVGEQDSRLGFILLLGAAFVVAASHLAGGPTLLRHWWVAALPLLLGSVYWAGVYVTQGEYLGTVWAFGVGTAVLTLMLTSRAATRSLLRLFAVSTAVQCALGLLTSPLMLAGHTSVVLAETPPSWRPLFVFESVASLAIFSSPGAAGSLRLTMTTGEPGTFALYVAAGAAAAFCVLTARVLHACAVLFAVGIVLSQSTGAIAVMVFLLGLGLVAASTRRAGGLRPEVFLLVLVGSAVTVPLTYRLIAAKAWERYESFEARGLSFADTTTPGLASARINLLTSWSSDHEWVLVMAGALAVYVVSVARTSIRLCAGFVLLNGLFLQPVAFHVALFIVLSACVAAHRGGVEPGPEPQAIGSADHPSRTRSSRSRFVDLS